MSEKYVVTWCIEVECETPKAAALKAEEIICRPGTTPPPPVTVEQYNVRDRHWIVDTWTHGVQEIEGEA